MIISIHGKNLEITKTVETAIKNSLTRIEKFEKFIKNDTPARVEVRSYREKIYKVTVNIVLPYKKNLHCEVKNDDLFIAIKNIVNPLSQQLNHLKNSNKINVGTGEFLEEKTFDDEPEYEIDELE